MMAKRVLYVSPCSERAGAEQVTRLFANFHRRDRWIPEVYFFRPGPFVDELRSDGIECHVSTLDSPMRFRDPGSVLRTAREINQIAQEREISLFHSVMGYGHVVGGLASRLSGIPEVWFQHGPTGPLDWFTGRVPTRALFVNSRFTEYAQNRYRASTERTCLVYPPLDPRIDPKDFQTEAKVLREAWGIGAGDFAFGLVGRIARMKGQTDFVRAATPLLRENPSVRLVLIGSQFGGAEPAYAEKLRRQIMKTGFAERIHLTGFLNRPQAAMLACDVIVNATTSAEPFGLTLIESLQMGRPVIAPNRGGPAEIVTDGIEGTLYDPTEPGSLARALSGMIRAKEDREGWESLRKRAEASVQSRFSIHVAIDRLESEYDRIVSEEMEK